MKKKEPVNLVPWEVIEFAWGAAMRHRKGKWEKLYLAPDAQEIDVSKLDVSLDDDGITFLWSTDGDGL